MRRLPYRVHLVLIAALSAFGQSKATFDVASVRPAVERVEFERDGEIAALHGTLRMRDVSLTACIAFAYGISTSQVVGPTSLREKRFDIIAKGEQESSETQLRQMLQSLLAERFHLTLHHAQKEMRGYVLTVFSNPPRDRIKFHPSAAEGEFYRKNSSTGTVAHNITMKQFAEFLSGPLEGPVADQTSLSGQYDLQLEFARYVDLTPTDQAALPGATYVLNAALKGELGLQITPRKTNFDIIILDHVEYPSSN
jgi:uncharacterized protein (TIGR03435 family)